MKKLWKGDKTNKIYLLFILYLYTENYKIERPILEDIILYKV